MSLERRSGFDRRQLFLPEQYAAKEREFVVGKDIFTLEDLELLPGESREVPVQLTKENYPFFNKIPSAYLSALEETTRSRYGQAFVQFPDAAKHIFDFIVENGITTLEGVHERFLQPKIPVLNSALRPNRIRAGSPVIWLCSPGEHLVGDELTSAPILINGKPPTEDTFRKDATGKPIALRLSLDHSTREYIPRLNPYREDQSRAVIEIDPFHPHPRDQLKELLVPVPETFEIIPYLVFSKEELTWPEGVYGRVRAVAYSGNNGSETHKTISLHGDSRWFEPNRKWRMIFELQGRTTPEESANYIDVDLFKAA